MEYKIIIDKNTQKVTYSGINVGNAKLEIIFLTHEFCMLKQGGYSQYIHRGAGVGYSSSCYKLFQVKKIRNFEKTIELYTKELREQPVKGGNLNELIEWVNTHYEKEIKDPWEGHSQKEREQLQRIFKRQEELENNIISNSENARKE